MHDILILNAGLSVEAVGFRAWNHHWLGARKNSLLDERLANMDDGIVEAAAAPRGISRRELPRGRLPGPA